MGSVAKTSSYEVTQHALNGCMGLMTGRNILLQRQPIRAPVNFRARHRHQAPTPIITVNFRPPLTRQCDSSDLRTVTYGPTAPSPREGRTHGGRRTMTSHWPPATS